MEPQPLALAPASSHRDGLLEHSRDLWRGAPAWRLLVGSTGALVIASIATGLLSLRHEAPTPAAMIAAVPERAPRDSDLPVPPVVAPQPAPIAPQPAPMPLQPTPVVPHSARPVAPQTTNPDHLGLQPAPAPDETACGYRGGGGGGGQGRVVGFLSRDQAARMVALTQQRARAKINPDYVSNVRAVIMVPNGRRIIVLVPSSMAVKPGDRVAFTSGRRDWSMACGYIPNLIIGLLQPQ